MDVAASGVAHGAAHMDLVVELGQERLGVHGGAASAHQAAAARSGRRDVQRLGRGRAVLGLGRVHLHEIGAQAQRHARGASDEVGVLLGGDGLAARVYPQHHQQAVGVGLGDELAGLGHHGGLVFAAQVDGVAQAHDVHARIAHGQHGVKVVELRGIGVVLLDAHQVGLGVHLDQVVDVGVVGRVLRDEPALAGQDAADAFLADLEQVLGIQIGDVDAFAVEVLVEVLDLLVASEQHEAPGALGCLHVVVDVLVAHLRRDIDGDLYLITGDLRHGNPPYSGWFSGRAQAPPRRVTVPTIVQKDGAAHPRLR